MIEQTSIDHLECCPLWDLYERLISILNVVGHQMILLNQAQGQGVVYYLGVIPDKIGISREVTNVLVFVTPSLQCTYRYFPLGASLIFDRFFH